MHQNLTEDRYSYEEKAAATKKANIYINHQPVLVLVLVRAKRLKDILTFLVGTVAYHSYSIIMYCHEMPCIS